MVSLTFVENAAAAHLDAARTLAPGAAHAGKAYFIAQEEPARLWAFIAELVRAAGLPGPRGPLPASLAYAGGALAELLWRLLPLAGEPPMTRFLAQELAASATFDLTPARRDFGYRERVGLREALARTAGALATESAAHGSGASSRS
jgi:nucleoside-diphosphate-sugar epimerase